MNLYSRQEIADILRAVAKTDLSAQGAHIGKVGEFESAYHKGFNAALTAVGLGLGMGPKLTHWRADGPEWIERDRGADQ